MTLDERITALDERITAYLTDRNLPPFESEPLLRESAAALKAAREVVALLIFAADARLLSEKHRVVELARNARALLEK